MMNEPVSAKRSATQLSIIFAAHNVPHTKVCALRRCGRIESLSVLIGAI